MFHKPVAAVQRRSMKVTQMQKPRSVQCIAAVALPFVLLLLLQACGGAPKLPDTTPDTTLAAKLVASDDLNSGGGQKARPVVVRLYELRTAGAFSSADFYSLYEREAQTLGSDLLGREEISLAPGQRHPIDKVISPETAYLGVLVAFRDIDRAAWRTTTRLKSDATNNVIVKIAADNVAAAAY